jgi:hypothetical protein
VVGSGLCEVGVRLGGQQDGVHPLGVGGGSGGRSRREGKESWQGGSLGLLLSLESN